MPAEISSRPLNPFTFVTLVVELNTFLQTSYIEAPVSCLKLARPLLQSIHMTLRVDTVAEASTTVVRVAGRLEGEGMLELLKTCDSIEGGFVLDLSGLRSADSEGIAAIRELADGGRKLSGVTPFIRFLLNPSPTTGAD
jgi:hypothetical protein